MTNMIPISEFAALQTEEGGKFTTPQKINYAIRKQSAPVDESTGKRLIDPEAWTVWEKEQPTTSSRAPGSASGKSYRPNNREVEVIKKKHGIEKGSILAWESGQYNDKISGGRVLDTFDEYCSTMIDDVGITSPLRWDSIDRYIDEKKMMVINYPEQLMYVLAAHYRALGEEDTANKLLDLYGKHKTEDARV